MPAVPRREARERALSLLYEAEAKGLAPSALLAELPVPADKFAEELVRGVEQHATRIDELIAAFAIDWKLERMAVVDRLILQIAVFELLERPEIPVGAVISEAVELAKTYSTEESGRFVNGVLGSVAAQVREPVLASDPDREAGPARPARTDEEPAWPNERGS
ncbi:MAG TPA: transcription antitermination factor NusB [Acidimicrobiales bacterium]|nr:transcription antitermination factor NusB [Acidimicrobiales bacterium]